uniref:SLED domain-containing protein n=1 Tax=Trichuris muris TaxID=70415 RepID=A0A5S6Q2N7_TRIMR
MGDEAKSDQTTNHGWNWEDFASGLGLSSVPKHALHHVQALQSDDRRGALVRLDEATKEPVGWWPAVVLRTDGATSLVLPHTCKQPRSVFTIDGFSSVILRSQAWCKFKNIPREGKSDNVDINDHLMEWECPKSLRDPTSWGSVHWDDSGASRGQAFPPFEFFELERYVAVESQVEVGCFWPAEIVRRVHGRLLLQPAGCARESAFWLSCCSRRVVPASIVAEAGSQFGWEYKCPEMLKAKADLLIEGAVKNSISKRPFEAYKRMECHDLKSGDYLEVLHPVERDAFYPAEVVEVVNDYYFVVRLLNDATRDGQSSTNQVFKLHKRSTGCAPMGWCMRNHVRLGGEEKFNWALLERKRYMKTSRLNLSDNSVESRPWRAGHYVEIAVGTGPIDEFALGIVVKVSPPFVWVQSDYFGPQRHRIYDIRDCTDLYPCGWSSVIDAPLNVHLKMPSPLESSDCSQVAVYVNLDCSLGPLMCKTVLQKYPGIVGPGPVAKVLGHLFKMILASVHRPAPLCRAFYASFSQFCPSNKVLPVKTNYANGQRLVELVVCDDARQVPHFLYHTSVLLGACCSLFTVKKLDSAGCPLKCSNKSGVRHSTYSFSLFMIAA